MHVFIFLKWGSIGYSLGIVQWDFIRRDHPGNPGRVSGSGPVRHATTSTTSGLRRSCARLNKTPRAWEIKYT